MPNAIGLRIYKVGLHAKGDSTPLPIHFGGLNAKFPDFVKLFIGSHGTSIQNSEAERSWHLEDRSSNDGSTFNGYIHYGTYGFESNFVDAKTKKKNYRRKTTDVEEIPLYFHFWIPTGGNFALAAFQSFQGRSCIAILSSAMQMEFSILNPNFSLKFSKIMPNDAKGSAIFSAPVKHLRLIRRNTFSDISDKIQGDEPVDIELLISARRRRTLGSLESIMGSINSTDGSVLLHDGIGFTEAVAEVRVGNRLRRVGVLGPNGDAGVIDVTDSIKKSPTGHPTFESIKKQTDDIIVDIYKTIRKLKS